MTDGFYINRKSLRIEYYKNNRAISSCKLFTSEAARNWFIMATVEHILRHPKSLRKKVFIIDA